MSEQNGAAPPQAVTPELVVLYQELPNGACVTGPTVLIGGNLMAGVLSVRQGFDAITPSKEHIGFIRTTLEVFWPTVWRKIGTVGDVVAATKMPPEPGRGPRGVIR